MENTSIFDEQFITLICAYEHDAHSLMAMLPLDMVKLLLTIYVGEFRKQMREKIKDAFTRYINDITDNDTERDFMIQHSVLQIIYINENTIECWMDSVYHKHHEDCNEGGICTGNIVGHICLTNFVVYQQYHKDITIKSICDYRGRSDDNYIYTVDLFNDYTPRHFGGSVYTNDPQNFGTYIDDDSYFKNIKIN